MFWFILGLLFGHYVVRDVVAYVRDRRMFKDFVVTKSENDRYLDSLKKSKK